MRRVLAGADATISLQLTSADGEPDTPASPPPVDVVDANGDAVAGSPFASTLDGNVASFDLPAAVTATLDTYTATATGTTSGGATIVGTATIETVGGFLFGLQQLRDNDRILNDQTRFPDASLPALRTAVEIRAEGVARRAFVPRAKRVTGWTDRAGRIVLGDIDIRTVRSVSIDGTSQDLTNVVVTGGDYAIVDAESPWAASCAYVAVYEYGLDVPPKPVTDAAMTFAREAAATSNLPARATAMATDVGQFRITIAGRDGSTGIPDVDAVLHLFGRDDPATA